MRRAVVALALALLIHASAFASFLYCFGLSRGESAGAGLLTLEILSGRPEGNSAPGRAASLGSGMRGDDSSAMASARATTTRTIIRVPEPVFPRVAVARTQRKPVSATLPSPSAPSPEPGNRVHFEEYVELTEAKSTDSEQQGVSWAATGSSPSADGFGGGLGNHASDGDSSAAGFGRNGHLGGGDMGFGGYGGELMQFGAPDGPGILRLARPGYPQEARRLGKEGVVVLKFCLNSSGEVGRVEILQEAGYGMDHAARAAILQSRFRPAKANGIPVACQAILPLRFELR